MPRCWDNIPTSCKALAQRTPDAIQNAGAEIVEVDLPSIDERINDAGVRDWEHEEPAKPERTVATVDAYNGINACVMDLLEESPVRNFEDVVIYGNEHTGTEGGLPGTVPVFLGGQTNFLEVVEFKGLKNDTYQAALAYIHHQTRGNGIDAALSCSTGQFNPLLSCDRREKGQQYAVQAGYLTVCIPIGVNTDGMPGRLSFHQNAFREDQLSHWVSAVVDIWNKEDGSRPIPTFKHRLAKDVPIEKFDDGK